jgi:hypothetical protein
MKILAVILMASVLGGSALGSERQHYIRDIKSIAKTDLKRIHRYEQNPPAGVASNEAATYESLVELDLYLLYREIHFYEHSSTTKNKVEAKLAQLSRDMEDAPQAHHDTAQKEQMSRKGQ